MLNATIFEDKQQDIKYKEQLHIKSKIVHIELVVFLSRYSIHTIESQYSIRPEQPSDLVQCSLVCRNWKEAAMCTLYKVVVIHQAPQPAATVASALKFYGSYTRNILLSVNGYNLETLLGTLRNLVQIIANCLSVVDFKLAERVDHPIM